MMKKKMGKKKKANEKPNTGWVYSKLSKQLDTSSDNKRVRDPRTIDTASGFATE
ncbi:MAG: hypothetical protein L3J84_09065 [Gammaproteobacteria bacterium]|nr:hypothetical protein [Gammaproteobacteria bacterium]